jgi:putative tryptophan/tyrosine transport system substrate-binding protein
MRRRRFLALAAGGALAAPLAARAQQAVKYRIGVLGNVPLSDPGGAHLWGVFEQALRDLGYEHGRNILLVHRSSEGRYERLPALAAELVQQKVNVIVAPSVQNVLAAQQANPAIPIVMVSVGDPVGNKLVASLAHPGGNVTGTSFLASAIIGKQLELLKQLAPSATRQVVLMNPANPGHRLALEEAKAAARSLGTQLDTLEARGQEDIERAFATMGRERGGAVLVPWDGLFLVHLRKIVQLAAKTRLAAMYGHRGYVDAGGLASYSPSAAEQMRSAAGYVDRILRGAKPGDLPVEQPTKLEFIVNLKTAKSLGLVLPPSLVGRADEVIQ